MSVKVQVNVINQLRLLRQSTFKDPLAFLDEDVQNAQRAKATQVNIEVRRWEKSIVISNNGEVLDDPQKLFSLAESGWDEETVANESPFGIGFFSNISVSDFLVIHTGFKAINFNVAKMLETGDTTIEVTATEDFFDGFQLTLRNFNFDEIYEHQIEDRAKILGKFVQDLDVVYNGKLMERKDLTQVDSKSPFAVSINEEACKGWLALSNYFSSEIKVFYKGRLVTSLENKYYCEGELHLSDRAVNLVAPDRKDIIRDSKYNAFQNLIGEYVEMIATDAALEGSAKDQEKYSDAIGWYANISKAKDSMKFTIVKCDDSGIKYLKDIIYGNKKEDGQNLGQTALTINTNAVQGESHFEEVVVESEIVNAPRELHSGGSGGYHCDTLVSASEEVSEPGSELFAIERPKFWVPLNELSKYETKVLICKHYDLCLVLAKNKFQDRVLRALEKDKKVFHINTLDERIKVRVSLTNTTLFKREERAVMLFDMLSRMVGKSHNAFALGDLMVTRTLELPEIDVEEERIEESVQAIYCKDTDKVYVDRTLLRGVQLLEHTNPRLALSDYKFILANMSTLVEELSFTAHMSPSEISSTILKTLGGE